MFTDIVSSTAQAAAMGDERWSALLQRFGEITTGLADRFGGTDELDVAHCRHTGIPRRR